MPGGWEEKEEEADAALADEKKKLSIFPTDRENQAVCFFSPPSLSIIHTLPLCLIEADKLLFSLSNLHSSVPLSLPPLCQPSDHLLDHCSR